MALERMRIPSADMPHRHVAHSSYVHSLGAGRVHNSATLPMGVRTATAAICAQPRHHTLPALKEWSLLCQSMIEGHQHVRTLRVCWVMCALPWMW